MIERYPAPHAEVAFHEQTKIARWTHYTQMYARQAVVARGLPNEQDLLDTIDNLRPPTPEAVRTREGTTHHDVVAFLTLIEDQAFDAKPFIHYGLTSSDLVENAHHDALIEHAGYMLRMTTSLKMAMRERWLTNKTPRPGRTHGQIADVTTFEHQLYSHVQIIERLMRGFHYWPGRNNQDGVIKSPGPTGTSPFVKPLPHSVPSTQVISRDYQIEWASIYLRLAVELEAIATLIRCGARSEVMELAEGVGSGSSAMPHKANPVDSEKVCGLARIARGHFLAIAENGAFWDDRDISNSSVERLAVPGLAATVEYMLFTMIDVLLNLQVNEAVMRVHAHDARTASSILQTLAQKHFGLGPVEASNFVKKHAHFDNEVFYPKFDSRDLPGMAEWVKEAEEVWDSLF